MPTTDAPEGLDLRKDGTIWFHLDNDEGRTILVKLRRPKIKELRTLRQTVWDIDQQIRDFAAPIDDKLAAIYTEHSIDPGKPITMSEVPIETLREISDLRRRLGQEGGLMGEASRLEWAADVVQTLGDKPVDEDDLPPWMATSRFAEEIMAHWLAVPTRRGGQ